MEYQISHATTLTSDSFDIQQVSTISKMNADSRKTPYPLSRASPCPELLLRNHSSISWSLHLMITSGLLVARWRRIALARSSLRLRWRLHKSLLLRRKLRVRRVVHRAIPSSLRLRCRPVGVAWSRSLDVVVRHVALFGVVWLRVGLVGIGYDDIPRVDQAGKETET